jgi:hypothetical protein
MPLIIWTHPQGDTDVVEPDSFAARDVARDALERGYAFMSLQFRHPTVSQQHYFAPKAPANQSQNGDEPPPGVMRPSTDIATTIQWARHYANTLHIDPLNIFLVGQSRGSLNVLTALMGDRARAVGSGDPPWVDESSLPNAVFAAQAQTTYRDAQLKNFFIKQYAAQTVTNRIFAPPNTVQFPLCRQSGTGLFDYWCHYDLATQDFSNSIVTPLSSYDELDRTDTVPVWIRYERTPTTINAITKSGLYVNDPGTYQDNPNIDDNAANCFETLSLAEKVLKCFDVHHPNFGAKLRLKWVGLQNPLSHVIVQYKNTTTAAQRAEAVGFFFKDYYCFFMQYRPAGGPIIQTLSVDGDALRVASIVEENKSRDITAQIPIEQCKLEEGGTWF